MSINLKYLQDNCVAWYDFNGQSRTIASRLGTSTARASLPDSYVKGAGWLAIGDSLVSRKEDGGNFVMFENSIIPQGDFTIRFKFKLDIPTSGNARIILDTTGSYLGFGKGVVIAIGSTDIAFHVNDGTGRKYVAHLYPKKADGTTNWIDVVATKTSSQIMIAVNGDPSYNKVYVGNIQHVKNMQLFGLSSSNRFEGRIDDLIILNGDFHSVAGGHAERIMAIRTEDSTNPVHYSIHQRNNMLFNFNNNANAIVKFAPKLPEISFATDSNYSDMNHKYTEYREYADNIDTSVAGVNMVKFNIPPMYMFGFMDSYNGYKALLRINGEVYKYLTGSNWGSLGVTPITKEMFDASYPMAMFNPLGIFAGKDKPWIEVFIQVEETTIPPDKFYYVTANSKDDWLDRNASYSINDVLDGKQYTLELYTEDEAHSPEIIVNSANIISQIVYPDVGLPITSDIIEQFHIFAKSTGDVRYVVSFDGTNSNWFTFKDGSWIAVGNASFGENVKSLENISSEEWKEKITTSNEIRFSYYITQDAEIDSIHIVTANRGRDDYADTSKYTMEYDKVNKQIKFHINQDGRYKVTYYDGKNH